MKLNVNFVQISTCRHATEEEDYKLNKYNKQNCFTISKMFYYIVELFVVLLSGMFNQVLTKGHVYDTLDQFVCRYTDQGLNSSIYHIYLCCRNIGKEVRLKFFLASPNFEIYLSKIFFFFPFSLICTCVCSFISVSVKR